MRLQSCRNAVLSVGLALLLLLLSVAGASATSARYPLGSVLGGLWYCSRDGAKLRLDLYYPTVARYHHAPLVLWIHGGTWIRGSRSSAAPDPQVATLRANGFAVAAIDYSLAPAHKFPAPVQDLTCGVRYLRSHHATLHIDRYHIGALGVSAGGHLAAMLGVNDGSGTFIGGGFPGISSTVQAVAALYGVHDLTLHDLAGYDERELPHIFGPRRNWAAASPIHYVRAGVAPFLLVHGDRDSDVPLEQSQHMARALRAHDVKEHLIVVHHAEHGLVASGGPISPDRETIEQAVVDFFVQRMRLRA
jgi:acetyl esterase/lipase